MKKKRAIYPGTFDPVTNGHLDIIKRASELFDEVLVAVAKSSSKNPMFDLQTRQDLLKKSVEGFDNVSVEAFDTLLVDFAKQRDIRIIIRGLRAVSDFEYELQMGYANASLWSKIETIYLMPSLKNAFISSSVVRSVILHECDISHLVPNSVIELLDKRG